MTIEFALTPDGQWDVSAPDLVHLARAAGFTASGIGVGKADALAAAAYTAEAVRCSEMLALILTADAEKTLQYAQRLAAAAELVGANWVLTTFAAPVNDAARRLIARAADIFAEVGARMAVEFSPLGSVTSITKALEVVAAAGRDRAAVMIDTWHFFRGDSTWAQLEALPLDQIAYVQFADALAPTSEDSYLETMTRRALPGDGVFDLERFASTLLARGWQGTVSVEVLSAQWRTRPVSEFLDAAFKQTQQYW